jgi:hypothetical protein
VHDQLSCVSAGIAINLTPVGNGVREVDLIADSQAMLTQVFELTDFRGAEWIDRKEQAAAPRVSCQQIARIGANR